MKMRRNRGAHEEVDPRTPAAPPAPPADSRVDATPAGRPDHAATATHERVVSPADRAEIAEEHRREKFGGLNLGAAFFGWIVAVGIAVILAGIVGAVAAGLGDVNDVTQSDLERRSGTIGVGAAVTLLVIVLLAYYTGGYVAGRMSRFSGPRQGLGVWIVGLVAVAVAAVVGAVFGSEYDVLDRMDVPDVPIPTDDLSLGGAVTIAAVVVGSLLAALVGGAVGTRYHRRVDRVR